MSSRSDTNESDEDNWDSDSIPETIAQEQDNEDLIPNKQYCIAYTLTHPDFNSVQQPLFLNKISPTTFFKYPCDRLKEYLMVSDIYSYFESSKFSIVQIEYVFHNSFQPEYKVVDKTFWLKLIQRIWKRKYTEKQTRIKQRKLLKNQRHFELHGKYTYGLNNLSLLPLF
jgi:hypothetical protein